MADLTSLKDQLRATFRDYEVEGVPSAGPHEPDKAAIRDKLVAVVNEVELAQDLASTAGTTIAVATRSELLALSGPFETKARAEVRADPAGDVTNGNGVYNYSGAAWVWLSPLMPVSVSAQFAYQNNKLDFTASQSLTFAGALIVQRDYDGSRRLMIGAGYAYRSDLGFQPFDPAGVGGNFGQAYVSQPVNLAAEAVQFHMWDFTTGAFILNGAGPDPVPGYDHALVGVSSAGRVTSAHRVVGDGHGEAAANVAGFTTNAQTAPWIYWTTQAATFSEAAITARGLVAGVADPTNKIAAVGDRVPAENVGWPHCFFRVWVQTDTDDDFGSPRYYFRGEALEDRGGGVMALETRLSARAAIYSVRVPYVNPDGPLGAYLVGVDTNGTAAQIVCGGVQAAFGPGPIDWVDWYDRAGAVKPALDALAQDVDPGFVLPERLFVWADQDTTLYLRNSLPDLPDSEAARFALTATGDGAVLVASGGEHVVIHQPEAGTYSGHVMLRKPAQPRGVWWSPLTVDVVAHGSGAPKVLMIGDSLTNRFLPEAVARRLQRAGYTPEMIGTIPAFYRGSTAYMAEGREGRSFGQYTYQVAGAACVPLDPGAEAYYLGLTPIQRMGVNPFLRPATGSDDPDHVFNGYVFDLEHYLTRFGLSVPDAIIIQLGENDVGSGSFATIASGLRVLYERIRATHPTVAIAFSTYAVAKHGSMADRWARINHPYIVRATEAFVRSRAVTDPAVVYLPSYIRQSPDAGWPVTQDAIAGSVRWGSIDNVSSAVVNGVTYGLGGDVHPLDPNVQLAADQMAAWIASL